MSLEAVKKYFVEFNMDHRVMVLEHSTATVEEAAKAHGVDPDQIGKTLSFKIDEKPILIVVAGKAKVDNKKYKGQFSKKAKMLNKDEALEYTGHAVGGVCPFGLKNPIDVYLDVSLKKHTEVIPAAGDSNSSIRLTIDELEKYSNFKKWVDVCKYD
ncbi:YbaK/EbsC family protein [Desulfotignum phosphitoxidans]|uniref:YbaK/prolyl-tRNA synthetase domain-containing protein n=1 Tax=Desulfotignum phosphitoxidans DSM 13687 TaxID=1286635 RepID=S0FYG6_9BACT|nr:YbaK/EbsC family protein [Desulfotignum phosphitoxidans]EMS78445.1 YbaK/prolyl-tRNA synthetase domain-containing protein [Desulfotignum phosphitoxidans DSM 13687]EMS80133.1 YbaK/prolyl-tRNA synthetase domain-containing protein [Desulfotignum phosphitoxidans DSM 13687]